MRATGLEPAQPCDHKNLNLTRLPIPPCPHKLLPIISLLQVLVKLILPLFFRILKQVVFLSREAAVICAGTCEGRKRVIKIRKCQPIFLHSFGIFHVGDEHDGAANRHFCDLAVHRAGVGVDESRSRFHAFSRVLLNDIQHFSDLVVLDADEEGDVAGS